MTTRPVEYRHVAVHMTEAIAAQLRGDPAHCQLLGPPVTNSLDLNLFPTWKVPSTYDSYSVHLLDLQAYSSSPYDSTTSTWTIDSNSIVLSTTHNSTLYTLSDWWSTHPQYDPDDDMHTLNAMFVLVLTGQIGSRSEQVASVVAIQRTPSVVNTVFDSITIT